MNKVQFAFTSLNPIRKSIFVALYKEQRKKQKTIQNARGSEEARERTREKNGHKSRMTFESLQLQVL